MKKLILILVIVAAGISAAYWYWNSGKAQSASAAQTSTPASASTPAVKPLKSIKLAPQTVTVYRDLPGRTVASKQTEIRPQVTGLITDRLFEEGSLVDEGQQLYQIDPAPYQATYESAVADLKKAQANVESIRTRLKRYKELVKIHAVSVQDYDDIQTSLAPAEADIAIAQAAISKARIDLDYTRVYAPISGRIGKSSVTKGALVTAGQEQSLATITLLDPIYVDMTQSSEDLMTMQAKFPDYREIPISLYVNGMKAPYPDPGKIQFHEVTVDKTTDSVPLRALFPNPDETLLPGLFVRARLSLEYPDVLLVPQYAATRQADGSLKVWRLDENNQAQSISVEANIAIDGQWIVEKGLQAGDVIVTEGLLKLKPGAAVKPVFGSDDEPASSTSEDTASGKK